MRNSKRARWTDCAPLQTKRGTLLRQAISRLGLSARAYHRVLRIARTIADLAESDAIDTAHVAEAIQYRRNALMNQV